MTAPRFVPLYLAFASGYRSWRAAISAAVAEALPRSGLADLARHTRAFESAYERTLDATRKAVG